MRTLSGLSMALLLGGGLFAQTRGNAGFVSPTPRMTGSFGSVVFPGGTAANPGVQRTFGNVAFPGGGGPQLVVPGTITDPTFGLRLGNTVLGRPYGGGRYGAGRHNGGE